MGEEEAIKWFEIQQAPVEGYITKRQKINDLFVVFAYNDNEYLVPIGLLTTMQSLHSIGVNKQLSIPMWHASKRWKEIENHNTL